MTQSSNSISSSSLYSTGSAILSATARRSMVQSQLHPSGIISEPVLNAYDTLPRENYLPRDRSAEAYIDETVDMGHGTFLLEPLVHGLMTEHAGITCDDNVLVVGDKTGYSGALLGMLSSHVTDSHDVNAEAPAGDFDVIFVAGAVASIPQNLTDKLATNGRLLLVESPDARRMGRILCITRGADGHLSTRDIKEAKVPYVVGGTPASSFVF